MRYGSAALGLLVGTMGLFFVGGPVRASGDDSCYPAWKLASPSYDCAGRIALTPGNDSRLNLFLLWRSRATVAEAGISYPAHEFEERDFEHSFVSWAGIGDTYFPKPKTDGDSVDDTRNGSRCDSAADGAQAFAAALTTDHSLPTAERDALTKARANLNPNCSATPATPSGAAWPMGIASSSGQAFLGYLEAIDAFYRGDWDKARGLLTPLVHARQRWVAETSAYMIIRVELGAAIANDYDKYGDFVGPAQADHAAATRAGAAIATYLHGWPRGSYAASAKGLERRALWLADDQAGLGRAYEALLTQTPANSPEIIALIEEIDAKLLTAAGANQKVDTPLLLATLDLMRMRSVVADDGTHSAPLLPPAEFAAQQAHFAGRPEVYAFLQAAHAYYLDHDAQAVLKLAPAGASQAAYRPLDFSGQVLHGMTLADLHDSGEAAYWRGMLAGANALYQRPLVELALARNFERSGHIAAAFAPGSPLTEPDQRTILLQHDASQALLRSLARGGGRDEKERASAAFTLLWKELSRRHYADFLSDFSLVGSAAPTPAPAPDAAADDTDSGDNQRLKQFAGDIPSDGYTCPKLTATVATLARSPTDANALLCLGDFYRNGMNGFAALDDYAPADQLGSGPSDFPGAPVLRGRLYEMVIADPRAGPAEKAYALYRAVNCYAPSGGNDCGGQDVPKAQRRAWFEQLKHDYAASSWAESLRYYW